MPAVAYRRRTPETEPLYQAMAGHLETFVEGLRASDRQLPRHVEQELRAYLECGILAHGFLRLRLEDCGESRVVAFSCKKRGFCPSCLGRRMADTAARLTEEVLPAVPVRQWVLSFPYEIRYRLAWDGDLVSAVLAVFLRVVQGWYRRQAKAAGHAGGRCGSVTFVQRFGSSINLNPHSHVLMLDGVYVLGDDGTPTFVPAPPLTDDDVRQIVETTAKRVIRLCQRRGLFEEGSTDPLWEQEPLLAQISAASVQGMVATGERAGRRVRRRVSDPEDGFRSGALCYASRGFSLHAATRIGAMDRQRLEQLCRYVVRPPVASGRLQFVDVETLEFTLKTPWADGTTSLLLSPQELLEKLAALVPPPRLHLIRYHGVLAPASPDRAQIVPGPSALTAASDDGGCGQTDNPGRHRHRVEWARLLARVFQIEVTVCPACGGTMKIIAALTDGASVLVVSGGCRPAITGAADRAGADRPTTGIRRCCLRSSSAVWPGTRSSCTVGKGHRCALLVVISQLQDGCNCLVLQKPGSCYQMHR